MAIIDKNILSIGEYLKNGKLEIPHFQRPYKWTVKNVVQLMDDINRFNSDIPYRIGTIVIYQDKENKKEQIVDGQQRTITFLLIFKAIIEYKYSSLNNDFKKKIDEIKSFLFNPTFKLDISKINIQKNYQTIIRRLDILDESFIDFFLNKCQITYFVIDDISEAFQFFDSQNARGKDLEPHDLLKAFHLREMHNKHNPITEDEIVRIVNVWENTESNELAKLFAEFLYRVRGWSKGNSSKYFSKKDTDLFKGITLENIDPYPYTLIYRDLEEFLNSGDIEKNFPFQLDQTIINGKHFFEMISYYKVLYDNLYKQLSNLNEIPKKIIETLNTYDGRNRTGDKYVRMLFDCALIFYIDKFGYKDVSKAIEKIFIWAYRIRLTYQNLQLVSVDNYVVKESNLFKTIKESIYSNALELADFPMLENDYESDKTKAIKELFIKMNYYAYNK